MHILLNKNKQTHTHTHTHVNWIKTQYFLCKTKYYITYDGLRSKIRLHIIICNRLWKTKHNHYHCFHLTTSVQDRTYCVVLDFNKDTLTCEVPDEDIFQRFMYKVQITQRLKVNNDKIKIKYHSNYTSYIRLEWFLHLTATHSIKALLSISTHVYTGKLYYFTRKWPLGICKTTRGLLHTVICTLWGLSAATVIHYDSSNFLVHYIKTAWCQTWCGHAIFATNNLL